MAIVNHAKREINAKIVYYGAEQSGKSTSLRYVYDRIKPALRGEIKSISASGSTLLFFDFSPFEQPLFGGYRVRLHLYTLQGMVANPAAWKMTLKGADGLMVVSDASALSAQASLDSLEQLRDLIGCYGIGLADLPVMLQFNKSDLSADAAQPSALTLGLPGYPYHCTDALRGDGVLESLAGLCRLVVAKIGERSDLSGHSVVQADNPASDDCRATATDIGSAVEAIQDETGPALSCATVSGFSISADEPDSIGLSVVAGSVVADGAVVRIPLEVSSNGRVARFAISVAISPETV
jgi:signal recognition particle receptor subunit beta